MSYRDSDAGLTIGRALTEAREAAGLALDDVAAQLRIRREFLAALEDGRPDALPGVTYAIGYVRTYAAFLGLDVEQAVTSFKAEAAGLDKRTELVFPSPAPEGRVPGLGLMFASVLLAGVAYGGWYWMSERGMSVYDMVPEVPERLATLIEGQGAAPSVPAPVSAPATTAGGAREDPTSTAESGYRAANPSGVPVTARPVTARETDTVATGTVATDTESSGATTRSAEVETRAPETTLPENTLVAKAPAGARTTATSETEEPPVAATDRTTGTATRAETAGSPSVNPQSANLQSANPQQVGARPAGSPPAESVDAQVRSAVPSAPRLSGLIGASEAAVHDPAGGSQAPAAVERIVVRATGESWVQVRAEDGTTLFTRVLRNGDVYRVPDRPGLTLATGNAGALEVVVDGRPTPGLGTFGEVVRNIVLDPERLTSGTAISKRN